MTRNQEEPDPEVKKQPGKKNTVGSNAEVKTDDNCRCKEVSKKSVPEMFRLMLDDLAFWKKISKGKK